MNNRIDDVYEKMSNAVGGCQTSTSMYSATVQRLQAEAQIIRKNADDKERTAKILAAHPEFEDLIWVLRNGQV